MELMSLELLMPLTILIILNSQLKKLRSLASMHKEQWLTQQAPFTTLKHGWIWLKK